MMNRNLRILNIALFIGLFPLAGLVLRDYLVFGYAPEKAPALSTRAPSAKPVEPLNAYSPIVKSRAFPSTKNELVPISNNAAAARAGAPLSASVGNLELAGTYIGRTSYAVVFDKSARVQGVFKPGERVFDAGVLKEVLRDRIELDVNGVKTFLVIPEDKSEKAARVSIAPVEQRGAARPKASLSRKVDETNWVIDQKAVLSSLDDMGSVLTDARLTPKANAGRIEGFLITEIRPRGVFDALGLKNGDILKRVNGFEIDSPEKAVQVLSALKGETSIDLDLVRSGKPMNFHYDIR